MNALLEHIDAIPLGRLLVAAIALAFAVHGIVLRGAWRRRRQAFEQGAPVAGAWRPFAYAAASTGVVLAMAGLSVHYARQMFLSAFAGGDPSVRAAAVSMGISGQFNAIPMLTSSLGLLLSLWVWGLKLEHDARDVGRPQSFPWLALLIAGFLPLGFGVLRWTTMIVQGFAGMAGLPGDEKADLLARTLDASRGPLATLGLVSLAALAGLTVLIAVLTARAPAPGRASGRELVVSVAALSLAVVVFVAARPLKAENDLPWPPGVNGEVLNVVEPPTPALEGPDAVERAPVVQVFRDGLRLDERVVTRDELRDALVTLRSNYRLLHPEDGFVGQVVFVGDAALPVSQVLSVFKDLAATGYPHPLLTFTRPETLQRPVFGPLRRVLSSAARLSLVDGYDVEARDDPKGGAQGTLVRAQDFQTYDALARRVVDLRRAGQQVVINVGK